MEAVDMKKQIPMEFITRQYMDNQDFELFYYSDSSPATGKVELHTHDFYELLLFLEGDVTYEIGDKQYSLRSGDYLLIPPGLCHRPLFGPSHKNYRRYVLWFSHSFYKKARHYSADLTYGLDYARDHHIYRFSTDFLLCQELTGRLADILVEYGSDRPFRDTSMDLLLLSFLLKLNRILYDNLHQKKTIYENVLYINICDYINQHLDEDLSLDKLASFFFVSKYHISHIFKDNMGISLHQYILKKRLQACKNAILSGQPVNQVCQQCGFTDYSTFFRAFKKEYGISPKELYKEFQLQNSHTGARFSLQ